MKTMIWWIRRDLRLTDNQALQFALDNASQVLPVFILDDRLRNSEYSGEKRLAFLYEGLRQLDSDLRQRGSQLVIRQGDPLAELTRLTREAGAQEIAAEPDYSPYSRQRDALLSRELNITWCGSPAVLVPGSVLKGNGEPFSVFTPFSRAWRQALSLPANLQFERPNRIPSPSGVFSLSIPGDPGRTAVHNFPSGEGEALRRLVEFSGHGCPSEHDSAPKIWNYRQGRDRLDIAGTSRLSPYLRFGMLSARRAAWHALRAVEFAPDLEARQSAEAWLNELIWRDFYMHILDHFPYVRERSFRMAHVRWQNSPELFSAWKAGQTGYPVVDAAMRQLEKTGWMHNRARMIVASFLTKDLLIDWRWGEAWFMQQLVDGDPASNNGGWQWSAGTGTDAAPYFRIFNPTSQSQKYDPSGFEIRRWLPELELVPANYIHQPWLMPLDLQSKIGVTIGKDYPTPVVDHTFARERALKAYKNQ